MVLKATNKVSNFLTTSVYVLVLFLVSVIFRQYWRLRVIKYKTNLKYRSSKNITIFHHNVSLYPVNVLEAGKYIVMSQS